MSKSPLVTRILTAAVLAPLVIGGVLALPTFQFALGLLLFIGLAAWEWAGLMGLVSQSIRIGYALLLCTLLLVGAGWPFGTPSASPIASWVTDPASAKAWLSLAVLGWGVALVWVKGYPHLPLAFHNPWLLGLVGVWVLGPPWFALVLLHSGAVTSAISGPWLVMSLMVLVWTADIGAYLSGRRWGHNKLAPRVSPGKTREGLWGALVAVVLLAAGFGSWGLGLSVAGLGLFVGLCVSTALFSVLGDLFESLLKRSRDIKDSSQLLPGHGGILDRIDSLTAAAPVYALGWVLWGGPTG